MFARAAVNRFWAHFFGRGFVNPLNDFDDHNTPTHPALLDALAEEFVASNFDVKHLIRCICLSEAYQRTSRVAPGNETVQSILDFAKERLPGFQRPRTIDFVDALPRNAAGKVLRSQVRAPYWAGRSKSI